MMRTIVKRSIWPAALAVLALGLAGCNTLQGAGKDLQTFGHKVEELARK